MIITYDLAKNERNIKERKLSFELATEFDFESAWVLPDDRYPYGEQRYRAIGMLRNRLHVLVFTELPFGIRVISLRKANAREVKRYESQASIERSRRGEP